MNTRRDKARVTAPSTAASAPPSTAPPTGAGALAVPPIPPIITSTTSTSATRTKLSVETRDQTLVAGVLANLPDIQTFVLPSGTYSQDELVGAIRDRIAASEATKSSKNTFHASVQNERQAEAAFRPIRKGMQQYVASRYGADSVKMAEFGFTPVKARKTDVRTKVGALDKAAATRLARHTMGKKEKLAIHGAVPATTTAPSAPASPAAPAPSAPSGAPVTTATK